MSSIDDLLGTLDNEDDPASAPIDSIKPFIRFDWLAAPGTAWPADQHPAGRTSWAIELATSRKIGLAEFHQFSVYAGMLAGIPSDTARFAADAIKEANLLVRQQLPMLMLQPMFREFDYARIRGKARTKHRALPPIASVAVFSSSTLESSPENIYSSLKVIWFQETFGLPGDPHILDQLRAIDWEREAVSWDP